MGDPIGRPLNKSPFPIGLGVSAPRHSAPTGHSGWLLCPVTRAESGSSSPSQGCPDFSLLGVRQRDPSRSVPRGRSDGPWGGRGRLALEAARSRRGRGSGGGLGRRPGVSARGRRSTQALPTCLLVGTSVCAPGQRGRAEPRGKRAPLTCSRRGRLGSETGAQPPGSSSWASSLRREPRLRSGTTRGSRARSPRRRRRSLRLGRLLQVPSPSAPLARWLPGRLRASAGGRAAAGAAPRRAEGGLSSLEMGKARRGNGLERGPALRAAPGAGHPGRAPCLLPPGSAPSSASPGGEGTPQVRSRRLRTTGSFGGLAEGCGRQESVSPGAKGGVAGVLDPALGVMIGRGHSSTTMTKKKW